MTRCLDCRWLRRNLGVNTSQCRCAKVRRLRARYFVSTFSFKFGGAHLAVGHIGVIQIGTSRAAHTQQYRLYLVPCEYIYIYIYDEMICKTVVQGERVLQSAWLGERILRLKNPLACRLHCHAGADLQKSNESVNTT
jgi:hypothetical protein